MERLSHCYISCFKHWISDRILCRNTSVIICDWWYNTSRHPAVQRCWSLQASPYFLTSSTPLSLSSSFMRSLQPSPSYQCLIHFPSNSLRALWFICLWSLLTLSNTFPFFPPLLRLPQLSVGRALGCCEEYQLLFPCLITVFPFLSRHHFKASKKKVLFRFHWISVKKNPLLTSKDQRPSHLFI